MNLKEKLADRSRLNPYTGCLEWVAGKSKAGYGQLRHEGKVAYAHRLSYSLATGEDISGRFLCHKCDNPTCIEPTHLFLGSQAENMADCAKKNRTSRQYGSTSPKAKLTEDQATAIYLARQAGEAATEIGKRFQIDASVVSRIARGKAWPHIHEAHIRSIVILHADGVI